MSTPGPAEGRVLIALCTYNERENLPLLIPALRAAVPHADLLFVDDNSPDGTGDFVRCVNTTDPQVQLLHREKKEGLGVAVRAAIRHSIEQRYDYLVNLDADFSHPPTMIPTLLAAMSHTDVAIASRYVPGGGVVGWPWQRQVMSWCINTYVRGILGLRTRDNSGSFRCYRVSLLERARLSEVYCRGYAVFEELLFRLKQVGARMKELPYTFEERRFGVTKINGKEALRALVNIASLRLR
ncbi:MAG: polyprenol monophosphomannose synthase [Planctomycetota bacterium]|nr:MAG: polyprenol monophosphomannose synthase [Planctomycetota bacterium]